MQFGLKDEVIEKIRTLFKKYNQIELAILYGSRAKGNYKTGSDIDLTLKGDIDSSILDILSNDIEELLLPYKFDISLFKHISNPDLIEHINRVGVVFYRR